MFVYYILIVEHPYRQADIHLAQARGARARCVRRQAPPSVIPWLAPIPCHRERWRLC